jgi:hypothetical protein
MKHLENSRMISEKAILHTQASNVHSLKSLAQQSALLKRNQIFLNGDKHSSRADGLSLNQDWIAAPENPKQSWIAVPVPAQSRASMQPHKFAKSGAHNVLPASTQTTSQHLPVAVNSQHSVAEPLNLPKPKLLSHAALTKALRRKAFRDLKKAKAEINQLELASGVSNGDADDAQPSDAPSERRQSDVAARRIRQGSQPAGSWTAIPVSSPARRNRASTQEASIVAELLRDIVSASAHVRGRGRQVAAKPRTARTAEILHQETSTPASKPSAKSADSPSSVFERAQDGALSADQAEKAAEAAELKSRRSEQCDACLAKWSAGARFCVMTVCHLHTSASLLAAPKVCPFSLFSHSHALPFLVLALTYSEQGKTDDYFRTMRELDERQLRLNDGRAALFARYVAPDDAAGTSQVPHTAPRRTTLHPPLLTACRQVVVVPRFTREWVPPSGKAVPDWLRESALASPLEELGVGALLDSDGPAAVRVADASPGLPPSDGGMLTFRSAASLRCGACGSCAERRLRCPGRPY